MEGTVEEAAEIISRVFPRHSPSPDFRKNDEQERLLRLDRQAKNYGLRVLPDGSGNFTLLSTRVEPRRPLPGFEHSPLWLVEQALELLHLLKVTS
jgi:hypothetical protein